MNLRIFFIILFCFGHVSVFAQLSAYNLVEYAFGNIPGEEPLGVHSVYDQTNVQFRFNGFGASVRLENYYSTNDNRENYTKATQYSLGFRKNGFDLKAGHFVDILGKGLLFRGYDIKNSVYENQIYRVKHGFYRDLLGAKAAYAGKYFSVKAIRGKSLISELPPGESNRRLDLVSAGEVGFNLSHQRIGTIYLHNENDLEKKQYLSAFIGGSFFRSFDYHAELAHLIGDEEGFFSFKEGDSYGIYFSLGYSTAGLGISFEFKDYQNLFIGSGISDPPTLVKEHTYRLLNRSTHVPYLFDESGIQLEIFFVAKEGHLLTVNHSRSKNEIGIGTTYKSAEYFVEWQFSRKNNDQLKVFADYSYDDVWAEGERYAAGIYYTHVLHNKRSLSFESEFQHLERTYNSTNKYQNIYTGLVYKYSTKISAGLLWEFTNDSKFADLSGTERVEKVQHYPGINVLFRPNRKNTLQLFAGKRRGGPACTAGICYEVIDFKGVELRWTIRI